MNQLQKKSNLAITANYNAICFIFTLCFYDALMLLQDLSHSDKEVVNYNIIRRHIKEVKLLSDSKPESLDLEYSKLRDKHSSESNALYLYQNMYKKNNENKLETLHGHYLLHNTIIKCNDQLIDGSIFVLSAESDFLSVIKQSVITITKYMETERFYDYLKDIPLPFIFIPNCDLFQYRKFSEEFNLISNNRTGMFCAENSEHILLLMEPFALTFIDLDYLVSEFINDKDICCFLYGFLIKK